MPTQPTEHDAAALPKDRPINAFRTPSTPLSRTFVSTLIDQIAAYELSSGAGKRARKPADQSRFFTDATAIICDLIHRELTAPGGRLTVSLSHQAPEPGMERYAPPFSPKTFPNLLKTMASPDLGLLSLDIGQQGFGLAPGRQSTISAGHHLKHRLGPSGLTLSDLGTRSGVEVIILRRDREAHWDNGSRLLPYEDTSETIRMRGQVEKINAWLSSADIEIDESRPGAELIDPTRRSLYRIFLQGRFDRHGRLYGGFWQDMKADLRAEAILIDGEPVTVLDYSQMTPRILYGLSGSTPPGPDIYEVPGLEQAREGVKLIINACLSADRALVRFPKGSRHHFSPAQSFAEVVRIISDHHPVLASHFFTGIGQSLTYRESEIMVDLLLRMMGRGIIGLPIHDAVVVCAQMKEAAREIMVDTFRDHTGIEGVAG